MENALKNYAATEENPKWQEMIRRTDTLYKQDGDMRSEFLRDYTRIIHSAAYRRLRNKTQVFFSPQSDHICTRIEHVNHVESISYTIAKYLGLNTELTRAISVAHDLGHPPFGHKGELFLSQMSEKEIGEKFWHEQNGLFAVDAVELLEDLEKRKRNLDLTYAVRDGIISHCGEVSENGIHPRTDAIDLSAFKRPNQFSPYTYEACVVKIADKISYIGRDIEDAKTLGILTDTHMKELQNTLSEVLGEKINNTILINRFISDVCENSSHDNGICMSHDVKLAMDEMNKFNLKNIYRCERVEYSDKFFDLVLTQIYSLLSGAWDEEKTMENLKEIGKFYPTFIKEFCDWFVRYTNKKPEKYQNRTIFDISKERDYKKAVITYMSGMTDKFAIDTYNEIISF